MTNVLQKVEIIDYICLMLFFIIQTVILYNKRYSVWKGVCGGNGIPQPNELIKISAFLILNFEWAQTVFLHYIPDYEILISASGIIGLTSIPQLKSIKLVKEENKN